MSEGSGGQYIVVSWYCIDIIPVYVYMFVIPETGYQFYREMNI